MRIILIVVISCCTLYTQEINRKKYFHLPHDYELNESLNLMGLAAAKLPEDIIETDDIYRAPLFFYRIKYGLIKNFIAEASYESNIITHHFSLGPKWNYVFEDFSTAIGADLAFWFGYLNQEGFNTRMTGLNLYPNLTFGYAFQKFSISLKSELILLLDNVISAGEVKVSNKYSNFSGYSFGFYVEQPLWKDNMITLGFRAVFVKLYYPTWAAFSTFDRRFYITEATAGLVL